MSTIARLASKKLIQPPSWLQSAMAYETIMGSMAYGVSSDNSDMDVYGFCIPPKDEVFPHLRGEIPGFGEPYKRFEQFQQHHIRDTIANGGKGQEFDFSIYSIVKYFHMACENNPNIIDSLFTPPNCVLHTTPIAEMVRGQRQMFLHKGAWHKFKGYAYAQLHKIDVKTPQPGSKRAGDIAKYGYDVKFAYHIVRLLDEADQILTLGDLDLTRDAERMKAIRRGEWTLEQVKEFFTHRERELESAYAACKLPDGPNEAKVKELLLTCLEQHYGTLAGAIETPGRERALLAEIKAICDRAGV
jgi:uncharacterized protein